MGMNPRARRPRSTAPRSWSGLRPAISADPHPNRRRPVASTAGWQESSGAVATLEAVLDDFTESWGRGECPRAEGYLGLLPVEDKVELIYHEYCLAEASDLVPDPVDYLRRFPEQSDALERLFSLHGAVSASSLRRWIEPADLPEAGNEIGPYRLIREMGRGSFARVFLAEQGDLGDRLVVVKVSTRASAEPRLLAQARHVHIVEVLRQAQANDGALHLVCMPFLGGATLAAILDERRKTRRRPRSGRDLLAQLDRTSAPEYPRGELARASREIVAKLSYPQALAWVVARLAEALDHAHRRGVVHGDLKPSNILITAEGTPMLFDFNLGVDWRQADAEGSTTDLGGTLAYMAPERLLALAGEAEVDETRAPDRHRADLYGLGLVLLEALTGRAPEVPRVRPGEPRELASFLAESRQTLVRSLQGRKLGPVPPSLRSILAKCLTFDPLDRYARGNELAEDLDRWRADRPLAFAEELRRSRFGRRVRRGWLSLAVGVLTLVVALAVGFFGSILMQGTRRDEALNKLSTVLDRADSGAFTSRKFGYWGTFGNPVDPATQAAQHLARYGVETDPDWRSRDAVQALPEPEREGLEAWLFEQVLRLSVALRARPDSPDDWQRALRLLDRTIAQVPLMALRSERCAVRDKLKLPDSVPEPSNAPKPPRWLEEYLAGIADDPDYAREALGHYREALRDRPEMFWAHYRAGSVRCRIDEYPEAAEHFRHCVAQRPNNPVLHTYLASFLFKSECDSLGQKQDQRFGAALRECDLALRLNPDFAPANALKARIYKASGQTESVCAEIDRFAILTKLKGLAAVSLLKLDTKLHLGTTYDPDSEALVALTRQALLENPEDHDTRAVMAVGLNLQGRRTEAIEAYDRVLQGIPGHLRARFERASLLYQTDQAAAVAEFAILIDQPRFEEVFTEQPSAVRAYHFVATHLLHQGKIDEALEVAQRSLAHVRHSRSYWGETIWARVKLRGPNGLAPQGETYYLLAQIQAVAARTDKARIDQVVEYLDRAFRCNTAFRDQGFVNDRLFDELRPEIVKRLKIEPPIVVSTNLRAG